jgi:hypothetical protein|tara:strand:- start:997 stop:1182 length:186 start_codon:yes stop_codon:yes gene_type:complete
MPKVGNKEFTYDAKGKAAAKKAAAKTGQPVEKMAGYKNGGKVKIRGTGCATKGLYARGPMA